MCKQVTTCFKDAVPLQVGTYNESEHLTAGNEKQFQDYAQQ